MQYTIEARELTNESTGRAMESESQRITVEANDADEAISRFVDENDSELVSFVRPKGPESIATVKKNDCVYLVRVYAN